MLDVSVWAKSRLNAGPALSRLSADQFFLFFLYPPAFKDCMVKVL